MAYALVIGNKNTSSWSLRPWIALRMAGIPFDEVHVNLRDPQAKQLILRHSPSGKVPALLVDGQVVWDSLAILEYLAEAHPGARLWPAERAARAHARAIAAEMHAGFQALRQECPMDFLGRRLDHALSDTCKADVTRIVASWRACRRMCGADGPFLFDAFTAADAMYAPVVSRFTTYIGDLAPYGDDGSARAYVEAVFTSGPMRQWGREAQAQVAAR